MSIVVRWTSADRGRERERLETFVRLYREPVYRLALTVTGRRDLADDVCQDVLIRAYRHYRKLADSEDPLPWLRLTTVRRSLTTLKKARGDQATPEPFEHTDVAAQLAVRETLAQLKPEQRALLALAIGEGWSYAEIAESLQIPVGTVASRLNTAKAAFRRQWGEPE